MKKGIYYDKLTKTYYIDTKIKIQNQYKHCVIKGFSSLESIKEHYDNEIIKWKNKRKIYKNNAIYNDILEEYFFYKGLSISKESIRKEKTQFNTYWNILFNEQPLTDVFNYSKLEQIYKQIIRDNSLKERKKYLLIKTFRQFIKYCYLKKHLSFDIFQNLDVLFLPYKMDHVITKEKRTLKNKEIEDLLNVIPINSNDKVMFSLFISLGARISEFLGLTYDSIDFKKRIILINKQYLPSGEISSNLKTNNSYRSILITKEMLEMIKNYIIKNGLENNKTKRLFPISQVEFSRRLRKYEKLAKIDNYSPHEFRHTKASVLASRCKNISDVVLCAKILGHTTSMFLNTYCHSLSNQKEERFVF